MIIIKLMPQRNTRQHRTWVLQHTYAYIEAPFCGMKNELTKARKTKQPNFAICCLEGRVQLSLPSEPLAYLKYLFGQESGKLGINYRKYIRVYNSMFPFTSMGGRVNRSINRSNGPYVF